MSAKTNAEVIIGGKVYTLSGFESEEYLQKVASYINAKIAEIEEVEAFKRFTPDMKAILIELNIADDYFKAKSQAEKLELDLEAKEREIYNLKHDLISNQVQTETDSERLKELEAENKELLLNKARLEAALEDALLGKVTSMKESGNNQNRSSYEKNNHSNKNNSNKNDSRKSHSDGEHQNDKKEELSKTDDKGAKGQV